MALEHINIRQVVTVALSKDAIIIDVRKMDDFRKGHIPMAINMPLAQIEKRQVKLPKGRTLIVYCETGGASLQAARVLAELGYEVINCVGGLKSYNGSLTR